MRPQLPGSSKLVVHGERPGTLEQLPADEYVSPGSITGLLRRRWAVLLGCLLVSVGAAVTYLVMTPVTYEAGTSLLIDQEEYNLPDLVKKLERTDVLTSQLEVIGSQQLASQVVRDLGLGVQVTSPRKVVRSDVLAKVAANDSTSDFELVLTQTAPGRFTGQNPVTGQTSGPYTIGTPASIGGVTFTLASGAQAYPTLHLTVQNLRAATLDFQNQVKIVRPDRLGQVVQIRVRDTDPKIAGIAPDLLAQHYVDGRIETKRAKVRNAVKFLRNEADTLRDRLANAEQDLQSFRQREGIVSLPDEAATEVQQAGQLRTSRARLEAEAVALQEVIAEADSAKSTPSPYRRLTAFPSLIGNPVVSNLISTLNGLENDRSALLVRRTAADPDAVANEKRITEVDAQLRAMALTYLTGIAKQVSSLDQTLNTRAGIAAALPRKTMEDERLSRQPKVLSEVYGLVETRLQEARIAEGAADAGVTVIDQSHIPDLPVWPRKGLILAVAIAVGLVAGSGIAWLKEGMDSAVHSRADAVRAADVRVLGLVPHTRMLHDSGGLRRRVRFVPLPKRTLRLREAANEAYAWLETSLALLSTSGEIRTIAVTSPLAREGKTINSANLALSMARRGRRVLLIDADLRRGRIHQIFGMSKGPGLAEVLAGAVSTEHVIKRIKAGRGTTLDVMPGGELVGHPAELLRSPRMGDLLASLQASYDMIVCDTPPVNLVSDSLLLARMVDGVILVARAGVTDAQSLTEASRHLRDADAPLLGVLLNDIDPHRDRSYDHAYRYLDQAQSYAAVGES